MSADRAKPARVRRSALSALAAALVIAAAVAPAADALSFSTNPDVPDLGTLTLNAQAQSLTGTMNNFAVSLGTLDTAGFNVTVGGDSSNGHSAVFKVYCPNGGGCGTDPQGYVSGGSTLPAGSLTFNTTGASWHQTSGLGGTTPTLLCNSGCAIDVASPVKVASQAAGLGVLATWATQNFSSSSISLAIPTTIRKPLQTGEVYHLDLVWTLGSGP
jgi:hypothetical protein